LITQIIFGEVCVS